MERIKHALRHNWVGLSIIVGLWLLFFSPIISGQALYFLDDLKIFYYPIEQEYAAFQHAWQLPQWSHYFGFGHPLLAWGQLGFFTPLHLILRAFSVPPLILLQISVSVYFLAGPIGAFVFGRRLHFSPLAATIFAALATFSGFFIGHLNHVNFYTSTMLLPWLLVAGDNLIKKPTLPRTGMLALVSAAMAVSGQPQVILYSFIIASIILFPRLIATCLLAGKVMWRHLVTAVICTGLAAVIGLSLASLNILPLQEFLPQTERNSTLPPEEYFEFSYPPYHAITLVLPYLYGGHDTYWGAKGFQELAAFVGLAPLFLAGIALVNWHHQRPARISALILMAISLLMATGKFSPLYTWLVESHYMPPLAVPGRFVFFFNIAVALLAATGLEDILRIDNRSRRQLWVFLAGIGFISILLFPFFLHVTTDERSYIALSQLIGREVSQLIPLAFGIMSLPLFFMVARNGRPGSASAIALTLSVTIPLLLYAWDYNPRLNRQVALAENRFAERLDTISQHQQIPPRLYSHEQLLQSAPPTELTRRTDLISPAFSVIQPITPQTNNWQCIIIETFAKDTRAGEVEFNIYSDLRAQPIRHGQASTRTLNTSGGSRICFDPLPNSQDKQYYIHITSNVPTGIQLLYEKYDNPLHQAYFIRKISPTPEELERSRKQARLRLQPTYVVTIDREAAMLARHLQATAHTSSGRWIGALSIRPYREFIEKFFANDGEIIDGDGLHAIQRNKAVLDLSGITHLIQGVREGSTDTMDQAGYILLDTYHTGEKEIRLYQNPSAYPKAFLVPNAEFRAASDETRHGMLEPTFDPKKVVYVSGDTPPQVIAGNQTLSPQDTAVITTYTPTRVDVSVTTKQTSYLVVTDAHTEQWQTYIDEKRTPHLVAYSVFKAAEVPPGTHTVSFRYYSPATQLAKKLTATGLVALLALFTLPWLTAKGVRLLRR